jgi:HEAT repeat protein
MNIELRTSPGIEEMKQKGDVHGLIGMLRHRDLVIQWKATEALGELGTDAIDHLIRALKSRSKDVRLGVIEALGEIGDKRAIAPLKGMLHDKDNEVRWESALALGEIGDSSAIDHLTEALMDQSKYVRYGAAIALDKIGWTPKNSEQWAFYLMSKEEWRLLITLGSAALPALNLASVDNDRDVRVKAAEYLGEIGDTNAIPALYRCLADRDSDVRWRAVLSARKAGIPMMYIPRALSRRPRVRKNSNVAAVLNFLLPGMGYLYLGYWWGILLFQVDVYVTLLLLASKGEMPTYWVTLPIYSLLAIHAWYIAKHMPDL